VGSPLAGLPLIMETPLDERREEGENLRIVRGLAESRVP
jgi:hypothetical protein